MTDHPTKHEHATPSFRSVSFGCSDALVDGSHANGLASVPFDGYIAELHKDERVLTAAENRAYNRNDGDQTSTADLVTEVRGIREELSTLRGEQNAQTGAIIMGNQQVDERITDRVVEGTDDAAKDAMWAVISRAKMN